MAEVSVCVCEDNGFALISLGGEVTGADIVAAARDLHEHPKWQRSFHVVWDGREVRSLVIEPDDVPLMVEAKMEASTGREVTIAVREVDLEIAKLCALLLRIRGREAVVVGTLAEAFAELGVPVPDALA